MRRFRNGFRAAAVLTAALLASPAGALAASGDGESVVEQGRELAFNRSKGNCLACHALEGGDLAGTIGPDLVDMESRYPDRELLFQRIWDETQFNPVTVMPPFGRHKILTEDEINKIVEFLYTL